MARKQSTAKATSTHRALRDVAFERTRDLIVTGEIAPGERLIEEALGQRLGMSRNPVRESLKILEREGFVTISPFRGAVVSQIGHKEAMDIFEIRELLDSFAAAQAARKYTAADLRQLRSILSAGAKALAKGDIAKLSADNGRFHSKVHEMSGNVELIRSLEASASRSGGCSPGTPPPGASPPGSSTRRSSTPSRVATPTTRPRSPASTSPAPASPTSTCSSNALRSSRTTAATLR